MSSAPETSTPVDPQLPVARIACGAAAIITLIAGWLPLWPAGDTTTLAAAATDFLDDAGAAIGADPLVLLYGGALPLLVAMSVVLLALLAIVTAPVVAAAAIAVTVPLVLLI